jgi:hypothetical protein
MSDPFRDYLEQRRDGAYLRIHEMFFREILTEYDRTHPAQTKTQQGDEYREHLVAKCNEPVTEHHDFGAGRHSAWVEALAEFDRHAPERERAATALGVFDEAAKWEDSATCRDCPFSMVCRNHNGDRSNLCDRIAQYGRGKDILPAEAER